MKKWKHAPYFCLPALALGVSVWAAPHMQHKDVTPKPKSSANDKIPAVFEARAINKAQQKLKTKPGKVSCCIHPACDFCISHLAMCQCGKNLADNKPVCRECKGGWAAGDGHIDHVNAEDVKVMSTPQVIEAIKKSNAQPKLFPTGARKGKN